MMHTKMKKKSRVLTKKCSVGQDMTCTKQKEKTGLKFKKPDTKTSAGSVVSPGSKTGAVAETVQKGQATVPKDMRNRKQMSLKIECCGSYGQLPTEKMKSCRLLSEI
jgi:hypothetical protein